MVVTGLPTQSETLDAFREELDEIISSARNQAGVSDPEPASNNESPVRGRPPTDEPTRQAPRAIYQPTIRELPVAERPRERLREHGPRYLNNAELVAILLRSGIAGENAVNMAMRILAQFDGLSGLSRAVYAELNEQRGLSDAKTCQILAALELGRRIASLAPEAKAQISCPEDAANLVSAELAPQDQENLMVLLLNTRNHVVGKSTIYIGTVNSSAVRNSEILRPAVRENAPSIIVVHNHPSGDPTPSPEDIAVTRGLAAAGKLMDIELLDHLVIGHCGRFTSMREKRLGFD